MREHCHKFTSPRCGFPASPITITIKSQERGNAPTDEWNALLQICLTWRQDEQLSQSWREFAQAYDSSRFKPWVASPTPERYRHAEAEGLLSPHFDFIAGMHRLKSRQRQIRAFLSKISKYSPKSSIPTLATSEPCRSFSAQAKKPELTGQFSATYVTKVCITLMGSILKHLGKRSNTAQCS